MHESILAILARLYSVMSIYIHKLFNTEMKKYIHVKPAFSHNLQNKVA